MYVTRDGVKLFYQVTGGQVTGGQVTEQGAGGGARDLFLLPQCQPVTYSRQWKSQIPYLSRYFRVTTMDLRGNGRSDRSEAGYDLDTRYQDFLAVLAETVRPPFALVAISCAAMLAFRYAVEHPDRLSHLILLGGQFSESVPQPFDEKVAPVIRNEFDTWRGRLFARCLPEPHSLKGIEDAVAWCGETTPDILVESLRAIDGTNVYDLLAKVRTPTLALHGTLDKIVPYTHAEKLAAAIPGARLVTFEGAGHMLHGRHAVKVNHLIRDFVLDRPVESHRIPALAERTVPPVAPAPRPARRGAERRILWLSSPIGLGHIQRESGHRPQAPRDLPGRHRGLSGRRSRRPRGGGLGRARASGHPAHRERECAFRGLGAGSRAARLQRPLGHGRDHGRQLHDVRRRRGARAVRPLGGRRGLGPRLLPAREPGAEARALRVHDRLHRHAPHARRAGLGGVQARLGEERRERRPPAPPSRRARSLHHGGRRGRCPRSRVRARPAEHAAVEPRALPLLRLHVPLRPRGVSRQGGAPARAGLP